LRNVAVLGSEVKNFFPDNNSIGVVEIKGVPVDCGIIETKRPAFDRQAPENFSRVLVRVKAFSCNYRDLSFIFSTVKKGGGRSYYVIGSDFAGEVVEAGEGVESLKVGDRVMSDCHYTGGGGLRAPEGVPTNHGSKEYQCFHEDKLMAIPSEMPDEVAAAFTIGAQTAYSMVRRLELCAGAHVLVTAARSNTSLFVINALKKRNVHTYATTTSMQAASRIKALGVKEVFQFDPSIESFIQEQQILDTAAAVGGFTAVVDPFFDLHLSRVLDVMAPNGRYITCGLYEQHQNLIDQNLQGAPLNCQLIFIKAMIKNIQLIGNCIGLTTDLQEAVGDYVNGSLGVVIDSVFTGDRVAEFFQRTYCARDRFGKVVYQYN
jgi:NADPH:quinone reductase-like Zn-dependent oxidoreductase